MIEGQEVTTDPMERLAFHSASPFPKCGFEEKPGVPCKCLVAKPGAKCTRHRKMIDAYVLPALAIEESRMLDLTYQSMNRAQRNAAYGRFGRDTRTVNEMMQVVGIKVDSLPPHPEMQDPDFDVVGSAQESFEAYLRKLGIMDPWRCQGCGRVRVVENWGLSGDGKEAHISCQYAQCAACGAYGITDSRRTEPVTLDYFLRLAGFPGGYNAWLAI